MTSEEQKRTPPIDLSEQDKVQIDDQTTDKPHGDIAPRISQTPSNAAEPKAAEGQASPERPANPPRQ